MHGLIVCLYDAILTLLFKLNGDSFRGSNCHFTFFASLLDGGHLLKKRICSPRSKFSFLRVDPFLGRVSWYREANRKSQILSLFVKMADKHVGVYPGPHIP